MVALAVDGLLPTVLFRSVGAVWNVRNCTLCPDMGTNSVSIISLVGDDDSTPLQAVEQSFRTGDIMNFTGRDQEADRAAFRVDPRVDFRREASSASAHTTISTLFLTPDAC